MTELSRRALLRAGAVAVILAPVASARTAVAATTARRLYTRSRFRKLRKARFRFVGPEGSWPVTLTRVGNLTGAARGDQRRFTLTFSSRFPGPPQGPYVLKRRRFAATTLFVVPDANHRTYQAVVNSAP